MHRSIQAESVSWDPVEMSPFAEMGSGAGQQEEEEPEVRCLRDHLCISETKVDHLQRSQGFNLTHNKQ